MSKMVILPLTPLPYNKNYSENYKFEYESQYI